MAEFGPAIFQVFADMIRFDSKGFVKKTKLSEYKYYDFNTGGFKKRKRAKIARKRMEALKNAIFKVIMLRARNELILKMLCGATLPLKDCEVDFKITFTGDHLHLSATGFKEKVEKLNKSDQDLLNTFLQDELPFNYDELTETEKQKYYCKKNQPQDETEKIIQSFSTFFQNDRIFGFPEANIVPDVQFCNTKQAACGSRNDRVNLTLTGPLARFRIPSPE